MYYAGIDYHKRYSFVSLQDESGTVVHEQRVEWNNPAVFAQMFNQLQHEVTVVYECGLNWAWLYEVLEQIRSVRQIVLANAYKVRLIAEAQIKTDKLDARKLALLLRLGVVPACHVPSRQTRQRKDVLRQRAYWVRLRTGLRNRVHRLIGHPSVRRDVKPFRRDQCQRVMAKNAQALQERGSLHGGGFGFVDRNEHTHFLLRQGGCPR